MASIMDGQKKRIGFEKNNPHVVCADWSKIRIRRKCWRESALFSRPPRHSECRVLAEKTILHVLSLELERRAPTCLGIYWPVQGEIDILPLARRLDDFGWPIALPVASPRSREMSYSLWRPGDAMKLGVWSIPIPKRLRIVEPDVIVVPLVAFDKDCYRLGNGGGYFDRYLGDARLRVIAIGVGFASSRIESIIPQTHDVPMDVIVTEKGIVRRKVTRRPLIDSSDVSKTK